MTEDTKPKPLAGDEALDLWRQGREAWNRWIKLNPNREISFIDVDFSNQRDSEGNISFSGYHFGDGCVDFSLAIFGDGNVNFSKAVFGDGDVDFSVTTFGDGNVNFSRATFGDGILDFSMATFGKGTVNFNKATFGDGNVSFSDSTFGDGNVNFSKTNFGNGDVNFSYSTFGDSDLDFSGASFGNGNLNVSGISFGSGKMDFNKASFGDGNLDFTHTNLRDLFFAPKALESGDIDAPFLSVERLAFLILPPSADKLKSLNLYGASLDGMLALSGKLGIIPDLRATRYSHQVDLSALNVKLPRRWKEFGWPPKLSAVTEDPKDAAKLRRLKEIAETNKDHQAALRFSADENRARRWIETSWFGSVLDMAFSACSNYGQSILRPFSALALLAVGSVGLYKKMAVKTGTEWLTGPHWDQSILLSISNSLPFLPQSRDFRADALKALYPGDPSFWVDAFMILQGVLSFIFLFLIGLGLRNRFRL